MSERQIKVKATYNKEKEKTRKRAISKFKNNEDLTEEEAQILREEIPTEEDLKQMEQSSKEFSETIQKLIEPQKEMIEQVSQKVEELTKPLTKSVQGIAKQLNKSLKPLFEEIDNQNKENPLTREEIEKSTKFLLDYTKEKEKLIQKINNLQSRQMNLFDKIFQTTGATEEEISQYKLEGEEIDFPVDIFTDISNKIQGKSTEKEDFETQLKKFLRTKLSKKLRDKLKENEDKDIPLNEYLVKAEIDSIQKACDDFNKETLFFRNRPSRHNLELIERKREINKELPLKYIFRRVTEIHFENITEEDFKSYLKEEIEILKELIDIQNDTLSKNREIVNIFSRASNPYFEGKKEIELDPEEKQIKEEFYNTSFLIFQDSSNLSTLARAILVSQPSFDEMDIEQQERIFEFLQYNLEDLEGLLEEWTPQQLSFDELEQFKPIPIKTQLSFNDKIANNLHKLRNNELMSIKNTGGKKKTLKDEVVKVFVEYGELNIEKPLEPFDKVVLDSIYSLIQKNNYFDIQMLKEEMTGKVNRHEGKLDEEIKSSIDKLRTTFMTIEISEKLQKTLKTGFEKSGIRETILQLSQVYVIKGGTTKEVYYFKTKPLYYEYEEAKNQIISKDKNLLEGGVKNATKQSIVLVDYLSSRIEDMKHQMKKRNDFIQEIKFETIFELILTKEDLQLKQDSLQKKKSRYKDQIFQTLTHYKKINYIKGFNFYDEGIKIEL